jgi:hypothetical protein
MVIFYHDDPPMWHSFLFGLWAGWASFVELCQGFVSLLPLSKGLYCGRGKSTFLAHRAMVLMPHPFVYDTILLLLMENSVPWMYI